MANFFANFDSWSNWSTYDGSRLYMYDSKLIPNNMVNYSGFVIHDFSVDLNGTLSAGFENIDLYNGTDNFIILRWNNKDSFFSVKLQPGVYDGRGLYFGKDEQAQSGTNDVSVTLYNVSGEDITTEEWPNKTDLPNTGTIEITISNNDTFDFIWKNNLDEMVVSGTHTDSSYIADGGQVGVFHTDGYYANMGGWTFMAWNDLSATPIIESFSATDYSIVSGASTELGWVITSGGYSTTSWISEGIGEVNLEGTSSVTPLVSGTTTYYLSAWNVNGSVSADVDILVYAWTSAPEISSFTNDGPITTGENVTLSWITSGATSAAIDNGIGWITPSEVSGGSYVVSGLSADTTFTLSAFDENVTVTSATLVDFIGLEITIFDSNGTPTCSGATFELVWTTTGATSAFIDNGIGWINSASVPDGSMLTSGTTTTTYNMSAFNDIGSMVTDSIVVEIYFQYPVADAGDDISVTATTLSGAEATLDASGSYLPDGRDIDEYQWLSGATELSTCATFSSAYPQGTHTITLNIFNACGLSATDDVDITVINMIPPVAIASASPLFLNI